MSASLGDLNEVLQPEDAKLEKRCPRAIRKLLIEPGACIQLLQLRETEGIERVVLLAGKNRGHICRASEILVMECDLDAILRPLKIELPDEPDNYKAIGSGKY